MFRRDITTNTPLTGFNLLTALVFIESLFSIKCIVFSIESRLILPVSDIFMFISLWAKKNKSKMNLTSYVHIILENHFNKTVINPSKEYYIKGEDELPR